MKKLLAFVQLARPVNLLMVAATLYAMRYWVLLPMLQPKGLSLATSFSQFSLLVLSVVFVTAAGNIINDYFDTKPDAINKPNKMIVGVVLDRRIALYSHGILTFLGIALAAYYGWISDSLRFVVLHIFVAISLWYYSTYFKRETPVGNILIALLTGLVPLTIAFFDVFPLIKNLPEDVLNEMQKHEVSARFYFTIILTWIGGFALFAFLGNLIRELYKDLVDLDGDKKAGRRTIPIVWSEKGALWLMLGYTLVWTVSLILVTWFWLDTTLAKVFVTGLIILPVVYCLVRAFKNPHRSSYKFGALVLKFVLLAGMAFSYFVKTIIFG